MEGGQERDPRRLERAPIGVNVRRTDRGRGKHVAKPEQEFITYGRVNTLYILSGVGASAGVLSSSLGIARCGRSAGCVLCALWAVPAAVFGGGYPVGVSISSYTYIYIYVCVCVLSVDIRRTDRGRSKHVTKPEQELITYGSAAEGEHVIHIRRYA